MKPFQPEKFLILVVDDVPRNLQLVVEILDRAGYMTTFATGGKQALERLRASQPDLILLDLMMPEMSGLEVCERIRAEHLELNLPIIFLTASNEREHLIQAFDKGAMDYINKPFYAPELLARVKTQLLLKQAQDELKEAYQKLEDIALLDPLTGLANRRAIATFCETEFARTHRYGDEFAVMMIDLDHFKQVNDHYGHHCGDECLKLIAGVLHDSLRDTDKIGRFGGEEFVAILPKTSLDQALVLGERLRHQVVHLCPKIEQQTIYLSVSIGISSYCKSDSSMGDALRRADNALYNAKAQGRNRVCSISH
ncbi:diguanylate cyclase [Synechocystis sp. LKSZ1]|uniref:GGDEF domain-containing response regulator n=1 Tax=Synechocystis sp. LKSZ1 TaxID=3144951 RepID=UPI00336C1B15